MLEAFVTNTNLFMIKDTKGILMYLLIAKQWHDRSNSLTLNNKGK